MGTRSAGFHKGCVAVSLNGSKPAAVKRCVIENYCTQNAITWTDPQWLWPKKTKMSVGTITWGRWGAMMGRYHFFSRPHLRRFATRRTARKDFSQRGGAEKRSWGRKCLFWQQPIREILRRFCFLRNEHKGGGEQCPSCVFHAEAQQQLTMNRHDTTFWQTLLASSA